jgi:hypothetical protein
MSELARRAAAGERFEEITTQTGRSVSEVRNAVLEWAEAEAAESTKTRVLRRRHREAGVPPVAASLCPAG